METISRNALSPVEDLTLQTASPISKFPKYFDTEDKYRYRLLASNGQNIAIAEDGYATKAGCIQWPFNLKLRTLLDVTNGYLEDG